MKRIFQLLLVFVLFQSCGKKQPQILFFEDQLIGLESVANARELGGYVMADGRQIRHGMLLRGAAIDGLSDKDIYILKDSLGLDLVFDFRTDMEVSRAQDCEIAGTEHYHLSVFDENDSTNATSVLTRMFKAAPADMSQKEIIFKAAFNPDFQNAVTDMYSDALLTDNGQRQYSVFLRYIIDTPDAVVFWHCSSGKDRTGMASALILAALGADRNIIEQDFELSNVAYAKDVEKACDAIRANGGTEKEVQAIRLMTGVDLDTFKALLDRIDAEYGSLLEFEKSRLSLTDKDIKVLRSRYLRKRFPVRRRRTACAAGILRS